MCGKKDVSSYRISRLVVFCVSFLVLCEVNLCRGQAETGISKTEFEEAQSEKRNRNFYRLIISPTAHPLPQDAGYFSSTMIVWPSLTFSPLEHFSITGGLIVFPFGASTSYQSVGDCVNCGSNDNNFGLYYVSPKVAFDVTPKLAVALTGVHADAGEDDRAQVIYAMASVGGTRANFTGGLGYGREIDSRYSYDNEDTGLLLLGGYWQYDGSAAVVAEMHTPIYTETASLENSLVFVATRFYGEHVSVDIVLATKIGEVTEFGALPLLTFTYAFGG